MASKLPPLPSIKEIIRLYNLRAMKQLSQNFLLDLNLTKKIVKKAGNMKDALVIEVGPGPGGITRSLLETQAKKVVVIEKDARFLPGLEMLREASHDKLDIHIGDIMKFDVSKVIPPDYKKPWNDKPPSIFLVGNLPFNVSTPLIVKWLENISTQSGAWSNGRIRMTLTFQKEVAERMVAPVMKEQRSRLSIMCDNWCYVNHIFTIPGKAFVPKPEVDVGVVNFVPRPTPVIDAPFPLVEKVVRHVFHYRRKMCKRGIQTLFPPDQPELAVKMILQAKVDPSIRPFALTLDDFKKLCLAYQSICDQNPGLIDYDYRSRENASDWQKSVAALPDLSQLIVQ